MKGLGGYGRYNDDPSRVGCPRAQSDMTPCAARDGALAVADDGDCVGCGHAVGDLLMELVAVASAVPAPSPLPEPELGEGGAPGDGACAGANCSATDGKSHSQECFFENFRTTRIVPPGAERLLRDAFAAGWECGLGRAIQAVAPVQGRPCDCELFGCDCHNVGDAQSVAAWDADTESARKIQALLRPEEPTP